MTRLRFVSYQQKSYILDHSHIQKFHFAALICLQKQRRRQPYHRSKHKKKHNKKNPSSPPRKMALKQPPQQKKHIPAHIWWPCVNPQRRRAEDAACSKPGVHVSESPGRFCSCDKAPNRDCVGCGGPCGLGLCVLRYVVKTTAPNSPVPPNKNRVPVFFLGGGEGFGVGFGGRFYVGWWVFERMLKEKKMLIDSARFFDERKSRWYGKIGWWSIAFFLWMPAEARGFFHQPSSLFWGVVMTGQPSPPNLPPP